jgi:hypothetical protein
MLTQHPRDQKQLLLGALTRELYNVRMKPIGVLFLLFLFGCAAPLTNSIAPAPTLVAPASTSPTRSASTPTRSVPLETLPVPPTQTRSTKPTNQPTNQPTTQPTNQPTPQPRDPVIVGAGDIAVCNASGDEATAQLLDKIDGAIFTLGDNVYPNGSPEQFQNCYDPTWGRFKARTYPAPGNHDYNTAGAKGYYGYFGARAGDPTQGYYSYDVGAWHIIVLNSEIDTGENSAQGQWLRDDLQKHPASCTLAMFHRPLFSSGPHGDDGSGAKTRPLWDVLYQNNADVILNGHDHDYERFAPQDPNGKADAQRGIREFVVGTGGAAPYVFRVIKPNSEKRIAGAFGVLKLTLHATSYDWEFVSVAPLLFHDSGTSVCH